MMKELTKKDMGWRCLSCGDFHQRGNMVVNPCCKEYNPADVDLWVSVDSLYAILIDLLENGFVANHEDDKDCGNRTYATSYDVVEIEDIKKRFGLLFNFVGEESPSSTSAEGRAGRNRHLYSGDANNGMGLACKK